MRLKKLSFLFLFTMGLSVAQEKKTAEEMVTDRPDATESSRVVPKGSIQIETGAFYETYKKTFIQKEQWAYHTTLVRYGLLHNLELRLGMDMGGTSVALNNSTIGVLDKMISPLLLGVKIAISEEKNGLPEMAFIGHLHLPFTASTMIKPETTGVDFRFAATHTLSEQSSLSYNVGMQWGEGSPEAAYVYTVAYGYSFTSKLGGFVELYGDLPENSIANHLWDTGVTYLLNANIQLDASVGTSITDGQDILISAGVSFRLPK
ncbi:transporter [Cellulophaga sp. F20128]|uniref:transporter n=1 Tax=Cellulophaga sp. F20128 TaxID=2926413 RepID=UPI001FF1EEC1|nr:transporter [Cellulophaga sp. F20128]MCK0155705.1 transporter [Cellulophaga sp. F20128]